MKCTQCEKTIKKISVNWTCPFCNSNINIDNLEDAVSIVLAKEGTSVISRPHYFLSLLFDLAPHLKDEIRLVKSAVDSGIYSRILAVDKKSNSNKKTELKKCVTDLISTGLFDERKAIKVISILTNFLGWGSDILEFKASTINTSTQHTNYTNVISNPKQKPLNVSGILKTALGIVIVFLLIILLSKACSSDSNTINDNSSHNDQWATNDSGADNNNYVSGTEESTEIISNDTQQSSDGAKEPEESVNTTQKPQANQAISGNFVSGSLSTENQIIKYDYTAPKDGRYRFDLDISNTSANYDVLIKDPQNTTIASGSYSSSYHGFSVTLEAGKTYVISVSQDYLMCDYTISIGVPNDIKTVTGESFSGSIKYIDQEDFYNYTAPKTGLYRFSLDATDVNANYKVNITDAKNSTIGSASYSSSSHGLTVLLNANETYKIEIEQYYLNCDYSISIGVPNDTQAISGNTITGSIRYIDQENTYTYIAPRTGLYHFDLDTSDVNANYSFKIVNSKNAKVCSSNYSASMLNGVTVTLKEGACYTITIGYDYRTCDYEISIGIPNDVQQLSGNTITGSITYRDQENIYKYTATQTGTYVFKLGISNKSADYNIKIQTSNNGSKATGHYAWDFLNGIETHLTAGETYTIIISYEHLACDYTINISFRS